MIKNLFLPERIGTYYLFPERIAACEINKTHIVVTQLYYKGNACTVERCIEVAIQPGDQDDYIERAAQALKSVLSQLPKSTNVYSCLPSSLAFYKELKLPFIGREKIAMVVEYEVEPLLPFALNDATIDFIVTKEIPEEHSSEVLVVAVQNQYIAHNLAIFESAGVQPKAITIDMIALYGLYKMHPVYSGQQGNTVLLDIEQSHTRLAYIYNGQLKAMRTIPKGLSELVRLMGERLTIEPSAIMDYLTRVGLTASSQEEHNKIYSDVFADFLSQLSLTLQSFVATLPNAQINTVLLFGPCTNIKGLTEIVADTLKVSCAKFEVNDILQTHNVAFKSKNGQFPQTNLVTLGAALLNPITEDFNLRRKHFALSDVNTLLKNIIVAISLSLLIVGSLLTSSIIRISRIRSETHQAEQEVVEALKERFKKIPEDMLNVDDVVDEAQKAVAQETRVWAAFSGASRAPILRYLLELSTIIDKDALGFVIERLVIGEDTITMTAQVRNFDELKVLERELRASKLFSYIEPQHDPKFTMVIHLAKNVTG